jgi:hypothetical protein
MHPVAEELLTLAQKSKSPEVREIMADSCHLVDRHARAGITDTARHEAIMSVARALAETNGNRTLTLLEFDMCTE